MSASAFKAAGFTYNKYLQIASAAVRRSLNQEKRLLAERRGESELRVARWENGKQSESKPIAKALEEAAAQQSA